MSLLNAWAPSRKKASGATMSARDRFASSNDWDPEETTNADRGNARVRDLYDPDPMVMLGRLTTAVARLEKQVTEMATGWREDRQAWRDDRKELVRLQRSQGRRSAGLVGGLVVLVQVVSAALHQAGILH